MKSVPVDCLSLDARNPRLQIPEGQEPSQTDLLKMLWEQMAVNEVALSIANNGWFDNERLLVVPSPSAEGTFTVVEGNRRLAAVRLLRDAELRKQIGAGSLDEFIKHDTPPPTELPVEVHDDRRELWQYLGFEHVNGTKPWDSYSKAAYVAHVHDDYGVPLQEIAQSIGDYHSTVKRLYRGYAVLRQSEEKADFDREGRISKGFHFSHLYTALDYPQFQEYLGIDSDAVDRAPVAEDRLPQLRQVMVWLYGDQTRDLKPVVKRQNPDLKYLRDVLAVPEAVELLARTSNLSAAYAKAYGEGKLFEDAVYDAQLKLRYALSLGSTAYDGSAALWDVVDQIARSIADLKLIMEHTRASSGKRADGN